MARTNEHGIRHQAKGHGKKWRPSPNDPALTPAKKPAQQTTWTSIRELFSRH